MSVDVIGLISVANAIVNVVLGCLLVYYQLRCYGRGRVRLDLAYAAIGAIWTIFYAVIAVVPEYDAKAVGMTFVRPAITTTLCILVVGAIRRERPCQNTSRPF